MSRILLLLLVLILVTPNIAVVLPDKAKPQTIVVPDDYPTVSSAIASAVAGDIIFVKRGIYHKKAWKSTSLYH
jgi:hypothetical protein